MTAATAPLGPHGGARFLAGAAPFAECWRPLPRTFLVFAKTRGASAGVRGRSALFAVAFGVARLTVGRHVPRAVLGVADLMRETGLPERTVRRALADLERAGVLTRRAHGSRLEDGRSMSLGLVLPEGEALAPEETHPGGSLAWFGGGYCRASEAALVQACRSRLSPRAWAAFAVAVEVLHQAEEKDGPGAARRLTYSIKCGAGLTREHAHDAVRELRQAGVLVALGRAHRNDRRWRFADVTDAVPMQKPGHPLEKPAGERDIEGGESGRRAGQGSTPSGGSTPSRSFYACDAGASRPAPAPEPERVRAPEPEAGTGGHVGEEGRARSSEPGAEAEERAPRLLSPNRAPLLPSAYYQGLGARYAPGWRVLELVAWTCSEWPAIVREERRRHAAGEPTAATVAEALARHVARFLPREGPAEGSVRERLRKRASGLLLAAMEKRCPHVQQAEARLYLEAHRAREAAVAHRKEAEALHALGRLARGRPGGFRALGESLGRGAA